VIRPLAYVKEEDLARYAELREFPIIPCDLCGGSMLPGDLYDTWRWWDGYDSCTVRVHPGCYALALEWGCDNYDEGWICPETLYEGAEETTSEWMVEFIAALPEEHREPVERWWATVEQHRREDEESDKAWEART